MSLLAFGQPRFIGAALLMGTLLAAPACGGGSGTPPTSSGGASGQGSGGTTAASGSSSGSSGGTSSGGTTVEGSGGQHASGGASGAGGGASGGAPSSGGTASTAPSCAGFTGDECQGGDCCESLLVPGGTIQVGGADYELPSFYLDKYEVTVARFRKFQEAAAGWQEAGHPAEGDGAHPEVPESGWRTSWMEDFEDNYAVGLEPTWHGYPETYVDDPLSPFRDGFPTYQVAGAGQLAVNFVPFHIAFAFCIWDGGRLPAAAEWLYAASGGDMPTSYVWGNTPTTEEMFATIPAPDIANPHADSNEYWDFMAIFVGSHPASAGRFGHRDLASGLREYFRDRDVTDDEETDELIQLGGDEVLSAFSFNEAHATSSASWYYPDVIGQGQVMSAGTGLVGIRCARDP